MNSPRPDPGLRRVALDRLDWLDTEWQKAHSPRPSASPEIDLTPQPLEPASKAAPEWNASETVLVILGGALMFFGFLVPIALLAGILCFILAMGFSAHRKS
jgi:hypothetical protein